jgi:hypothetical protein
MRFLLDCDDVLLDWIDGFRKYASRELGLPIMGRPTSWDMTRWLGVSQRVVDHLIESFNNSDAFGALHPANAAEAVVPALKTAGHKLSVITSCSGDSAVGARRYHNLIAVFGPVFDEIICLPLGESKEHALRRFEPSIWVEDNYQNALTGSQLGHTPVIIRKPHNVEFEALDVECVWIDSWCDLLGAATGDAWR